MIQAFKDRLVKAKAVFDIKEITKNQAYAFVKTYHYLAEAKFFSCVAYGLFLKDGTLVGCATFSNPQGNVALKGWFSLPNTDKSVLELSRLCLLPDLNGSNATSYLLGNACRLLGKDKNIRAVITLADDSRHVGSIYQVCNFKYYGRTNVKSDFFRHDGKVNPRGPTQGVQGVWVPRTRKHRYAYIIDPTLKCNYEETNRPTASDTSRRECCGGTGLIEDKRNEVLYACPYCVGFKKYSELC